MCLGMPLVMAGEGFQTRVLGIRAGRGLTKRLLAMGFTQGTKVKVVKNTRGQLIVQMGDSRYALSRGIAQKIYVADRE